MHEPPAPARGVLNAFEEIGTEGTMWMAEDPAIPGRGGLLRLEDGDGLRVLDAAGRVIHDGPVALDREACRPFPESGPQGWRQVVDGAYMHGVQAGMDPGSWAAMSRDGRRAFPRRRTPPPPYPFAGPPALMAERLRAMPGEDALALFRHALHPWLVPYGGGGFFSYVQEWGTGLPEAAAFLGAGSPAPLLDRGSRPRPPSATLLPFSPGLLARLGMLCGIRGELRWLSESASERGVRLRAPRPGLVGARPADVMSAPGDGPLAVLGEIAGENRAWDRRD